MKTTDPQYGDLTRLLFSLPSMETSDDCFTPSETTKSILCETGRFCNRQKFTIAEFPNHSTSGTAVLLPTRSEGIVTPSTGWADQLSAVDPQEKVDGLRQIAQINSIEGWTVLIVRLAGDRHDEVRLRAAEVLSRSVCPAANEATDLAELLRSATDGEVCYWAATMLGTLGPKVSADTPAIDALKNCLAESMYLPAREQSAWALRRIGPPAASAVDTLRAAAVDAPPRLRRLASDAIRMIGEAA